LANADVAALALPALCELVWVLSQGYKAPTPEVAEAIRRLVNAANVVVNRPAVEVGLAMLDAEGDFADGIIAYEESWLGAGGEVDGSAGSTARIRAPIAFKSQMFERATRRCRMSPRSPRQARRAGPLADGSLAHRAGPGSGAHECRRLHSRRDYSNSVENIGNVKSCSGRAVNQNRRELTQIKAAAFDIANILARRLDGRPFRTRPNW
jgi:hypothetical protein